jgi:antitoxin (DNA-binding transcriptional repressor) of toxin-antitoxin stability system
MKALTYNEVIDNILKILEMVQSGEEIVIKNIKTQENVAVIIPYKKYQKKNNLKKKQERQLGILKGKASFKVRENFKITDEELLTL